MSIIIKNKSENHLDLLKKPLGEQFFIDTPEMVCIMATFKTTKGVTSALIAPKMIKESIITMTLSEQKFARDEGKRLVAAALNGVPHANVVFHFNEHGHPMPSGLAPVRFNSYGGRMSILSHSDQATDILISNLPAILDRITARFGVIPSLNLRHGLCGIEPSRELVRYKARCVVASKACKAFEAANELQRAEIAHRVVVHGLERQARAFGIDLDAFTLPTIHEIEIIHANSSAPLSIGGEIRYRTTADIDFLLDANLMGSWAIGGQTSNGFGTVTYANPKKGVPYVGL